PFGHIGEVGGGGPVRARLHEGVWQDATEFTFLHPAVQYDPQLKGEVLMVRSRPGGHLHLAVEEFQLELVARGQFAKLVAGHPEQDRAPLAVDGGHGMLPGGDWSSQGRPASVSAYSAARRPALLGSMQAPAVGNSLAGLQRLSGLNAARSRSITAR